MRRRIQGLIMAYALAFPACVASREGGPSDTAAEASSERTPRESLLAAFALFDGTGHVAARTVLAELRRFDGKTKAPEGPIITLMVPLVATLVNSPQNVTPGDLEAVAKQMAQLAAYFPRDYATQLAVVTGLYRLQARFAGGEVAAGDAADGGGSSVARAEGLAAAFPSRAEAYAHLGRVREAKGGAALDALRSYARCMELAPQFAECQERFAALAVEYTRPRCARFKRDGLAVHAAHTQPGKSTTPIDVAGAKAHMDPKPALTGEQVQDIHERKGSGTTTNVRLELTPAGTARFAVLTAELAAEAGYLAVLVGGKVAALPRVSSAVDTGQLSLAFGDAVPWATLCESFESQKLPPELARLAPKSGGRP